MVVRSIVQVQENGQLTLPVELRERLGLRQGDEVTLTETPDGILITPYLAELDQSARYRRGTQRDTACHS